MRVALVNPRWSFDGSIYFGCREPHLPLELGYAAALLEETGHEPLLLDGALMDLDNHQLAERVAYFDAEMTVVTTAPTYLFWRCAQPELRVPRDLFDHLGDLGGTRVAVGPHGSSTPRTALRKLGCDVVVLGESEEALVELASGKARGEIDGLALRREEDVKVTGGPRVVCLSDLPAQRWPRDWLKRHGHHHHRFGTQGAGWGAEVEASRGCPYHCSFCAKIDFRDAYRRRELDIVLAEIDGLIERGVRYIYFVDEIFLPNRSLLEALRERKLEFGVQTRIDLWKPPMLDLLAEAGCVSVEAGIESFTEAGRAMLAKRCRDDTATLVERLVHARRGIPFVQGNLIATAGDDPELAAHWRDALNGAGVWTNDPVPLYPYPSSPDYRRLWGEPDDRAWERAHEHYLRQFSRFSDIQDERPEPLERLEATCGC